MKLTYIANARIPTEKAHGIQIMKMCEAFALSNSKVELVIPKRLNNIKEGPYVYYGVEHNFKIKKLPCLDLVKFGKVGFYVQSLTFAISSFFYTMPKKSNIIYSRDELPLYFLSFFKKNIFWETHMAKSNFIIKRILCKSNGIISITQGLKNFYLKSYKINPDKVLVAPDGVDIKKSKVKSQKSEIREILNLPQNKEIILYTGHLYSWKGIDTLIKSAKFLNKNTLVYLVGGTKKDIIKTKKQTANNQNIVVVGDRPHFEIPDWQKSADVLILPNTAKEDISKYYTSPMKLFEYMASGVPVIASDLPSIREILNKNNSVLVGPDDPEKLAKGIKKVLQDPYFADGISKQAYEDVQNYTWQKRVNYILKFMK